MAPKKTGKNVRKTRSGKLQRGVAKRALTRLAAPRLARLAAPRLARAAGIEETEA